MLKKVVLTVSFLALVTPTAFAANSVSFEGKVFALPDTVAPVVINEDCSLDNRFESYYMSSCNLKARSYGGGGWEFLFYKGARLMPHSEMSDPWDQDNLKNLKALLAGTSKLSDFYDEEGMPLYSKASPFELAPFTGGYLIRDIEELKVNGTLYGYAFTPAMSGGDFPPGFMQRKAVLYLAEQDLVVIVSHHLNLPEEASAYTYMQEHGELNKSGNVDLDFYSGHDKELAVILNQFFEEQLKNQNTQEYKDVTATVQEMLTGTPTTIFSDMKFSAPLYDAIAYVKARGYVGGYPDGTYKPDAPINRAEFTKILVEARGGDKVESYATNSCFPDVPASQWFTKYVCYAKDQKIIKGYPDGTFGPENNINMAEALKIVLNSYEIDTPKEGANWYDPYLTSATENGFLGRISSSPATFVKRGELAELITRVENSVSFIFYGE